MNNPDKGIIGLCLMGSWAARGNRCLLALVVGVAGFIASWIVDGLSTSYKSYGEVPIPGNVCICPPAT